MLCDVPVRSMLSTPRCTVSMVASQQPAAVTDAQKKLLMREAAWKPGEVAPAHLTGVMAGDAGFDPLLLTALANKPVGDLITGGFPNMAQRQIILANQTPEQVQA